MGYGGQQVVLSVTEPIACGKVHQLFLLPSTSIKATTEKQSNCGMNGDERENNIMIYFL